MTRGPCIRRRSLRRLCLPVHGHPDARGVAGHVHVPDALGAVQRVDDQPAFAIGDAKGAACADDRALSADRVNQIGKFPFLIPQVAKDGGPILAKVLVDLVLADAKLVEPHDVGAKLVDLLLQQWQQQMELRKEVKLSPVVRSPSKR